MRFTCLLLITSFAVLSGCAESVSDTASLLSSNESPALEYPWSEDDIQNTLSVGSSATMSTSYFGCNFGCEEFGEGSEFVVSQSNASGYQVAVKRFGAPDLDGETEEYMLSNPWAQALVGDWPFTEANTTVSYSDVLVGAGLFENCTVYTFVEKSTEFARCCGNRIRSEGAELVGAAQTRQSQSSDARASSGGRPTTTWNIYFHSSLPGIPVKIVQETSGTTQIDELVEYEVASD